MHKILIIEDDRNLRRSLAITLKMEGYDVVEALDDQNILAILEHEMYDLVLTDLRMTGIDGLEVLRHVKQISPSTEVVVMTAFGTVESAVTAMKEGACDYLTKPFPTEELFIVIRKAIEQATLRMEVARLQKIIDEQYGFNRILTADPAMKQLLKTAAMAARTDAIVLLLGETGTGKELFASAIHHNSPRKDKPFIAVNCGALPTELIESELFGHAKGAFTSAIAKKSGMIEEAHEGSIFLDEIVELPPSAQVTLLRFIENGEIRRVGENVVRKLDVRIIAATNRDLKAETTAGRFREDLFYRLNVIPLRLPPLRERRGDIPLLAQHFLDHYRKKFRKPASTISSDAVATLLHYSWPGNVRELENAIERAVALSENQILTRDDFPPEISGNLPPIHPPTTINDLEKIHILEMLKTHDWNRQRTCQILGISKSTLYRRLKEYNIDQSDL